MTSKNGTQPKRTPFKIVYQLIVATRDDKGEIVGENPALRPTGDGNFVSQEFVLYVSEFDDLRKKIEEIMPQIEEQFDQLGV